MSPIPPREVMAEWWRKLNEADWFWEQKRRGEALMRKERDMESNVGTSVEMPRWKCHKEVWALKIEGIMRQVDGIDELSFVRPYGPVRVTSDWVAKHGPQIGGYYVVYKDGYESYSPAAAFEEGYTPLAQASRADGPNTERPFFGDRIRRA